MATGDYRFIPCAIGDEVYAIRKFNGVPRIKKGKVSQMYFVGEKMKLAIVVDGIARGEWGKTVFATREEAQRSLEKCPDCRYFVGCEKSVWLGQCDSYERKVEYGSQQ